MAAGKSQSGRTWGPAALADRHGLSAQAIRNYEADGFLPEATRTASGYRSYTRIHLLALDAYLALVAAHSYATAAMIMRAVNQDELETALAALDDSHELLRRDRLTLQTVRTAVEVLTEPDHPSGSGLTGPAATVPSERVAPAAAYSIGEVAHRLGLSPATLRTWERVGILTPTRNKLTGQRVFRADDLRDAELASLLRRGGEGLSRIAIMINQVRDVGSVEAVVESLAEWQQRITRRGRAMIMADRVLADYLDERERGREIDLSRSH